MCNTVRDTTPDLGSASGSSSASASAPVPRGARARRLCLPTTRELRYLSNINVRRSTGRAMFYTRTTAFSLLVWPLVIYDGDNKPKVKRETTTETASSASAGTEEDEGFVSADVGFEDCNIDDEEDDNNNDNDADDSDSSDNDYKSEDDTDSSGFETTDNDEQSINGRGSGKDSADMNSIATKSRFHGKTQSKMAQYPDTVPPWAYIVSIRTPKPILGKRATQRNRAKRRIRAVAGQILPLFAVRGIEYCFTLNPEILLIEHKVLVADMHSALKAVNCWSDYMTEDMVRREKYCER